jgi:hypothetical protein
MIRSPSFQERSARYGLKGALNKGVLDNIELAQQIAETRYRALVGREILISEISDIHQLIEELRAWVIAPPVQAENIPNY